MCSLTLPDCVLLYDDVFLFVLLSQTSVLSSTTQISDAFSAPLREKESFLLGTGLVRCYQRSANLSNNVLVSGFVLGGHRYYIRHLAVTIVTATAAVLVYNSLP